MISGIGSYNCKGESIGKRLLVRYADDFVILCETKEDALEAKIKISQWLNNKGLNLSEEKTQIAHITKGFNFLGFNVRQYKVNNTKTGYKLLIKPSKESIKRVKTNLRNIFLQHKGKHVRLLISKINPVIRGVANYFRKEVASKIFSDLDHYLFTRQVRYAKFTHPKKKKKWTQDKYWGRMNLQRPNAKWVFGDKCSGAYMLKFGWFSIKRHVPVRKDYSPDNPDLKEYWENRRKKSQKTESEKLNRTKEYVAYKQEYRCPICSQSIFNDEPLHLHHVIPRCEGGKDSTNNLIWVHLFCHHKVHYQNKIQKE